MKVEYITVHKASLGIDPTYQRTEEVNSKLIDKISKEYNPALFGCPVVARRSDGSLWVIDGQHRVIAISMNANVDTIQVMAVDVVDRKHEADLFVALNTKRTSVSSYGRFHAAVAAKHPLEMEIDGFLTSIGIFAGPKGNKGRLTCIGEVISNWKKNKKFCKLSLMQIAEILEGAGSPNVHLVRGLFYLAWKTNGASLHHRYTRKFSRLGQEALIERAELRQYHKEPLEGALRLARIANLRQSEKLDVTGILEAIGSGEVVSEAA